MGRVIEVDIESVVMYSERAIMVKQGDNTVAWVPMGVIKELQGLELGDVERVLEETEWKLGGAITIPEWMAVQKGLI